MSDFCYDTEFLDDGRTIELISIGIVHERDSYYAVNADCDFDRVREHDWLWANVVPTLPTVTTLVGSTSRSGTSLNRLAACVKPKWVIANEVRDFILQNSVGAPKLWAYYGAYDHVALAQLFGPMSDLPEGIPMWTHDLMQLAEDHPEVKKPFQAEESLHNALEDAQWNQRYLIALRTVEEKK